MRASMRCNSRYPATWKHGWSKHGSRIMPSRHFVPQDLYSPCLNWTYYARTMFTPTMFSRRRVLSCAIDINMNVCIYIYIYVYTHGNNNNNNSNNNDHNANINTSSNIVVLILTVIVIVPLALPFCASSSISCHKGQGESWSMYVWACCPW